jgi:hypothetical protein
MSDKISLIVGRKGDAGPSVSEDPPPLTARMQWMADLVCAILSAETDRKATVGTGLTCPRHHAGK